MSASFLTFARRARALCAPLVAMVAMVLQVTFYAEHLGATAAHELGLAPVEARLGFLQICTGEGVQLLDPATGQMVGQGSGAPVSHSSSDCAVCSSAGVCSFDAPSSAAAPLLQALLLGPATVAVPVASVVVLRPTHKGLIRAPPALA